MNVLRRKILQKRYKSFNLNIQRPDLMRADLYVEAPVDLSISTFLGKVEVGSFTYFGQGCVVRNTKIGRFCSIATNCTIGSFNHPTDRVTTHPIVFNTVIRIPDMHAFYEINEPVPFDKKIQYCVIGNDVWIGSNVFIRSGVDIGNGAVVGANAVVVKDVPDYAIVAGNPAKVIRYRFSEKIIQALNQSRWWEYDLSLLRKRGVSLQDPIDFLHKFEHEKHLKNLNQMNFDKYQISGKNKKIKVL